MISIIKNKNLQAISHKMIYDKICQSKKLFFDKNETSEHGLENIEKKNKKINKN